jgi:signal transduction histidine kinase
MKRLLERQYDVICAENGQAAFEALETEDFDAVVLDIMMPGINGLQVLEAIRQQADFQLLPVILVSALSDSQTIAEGFRLGANDYITRPIDIRVTLARINAQVELYQLRMERERSQRELENAQQIRTRLFRVASHDLKNPLANVRMAEYLLRENARLDPGARRMIDAMTYSLDAMQEVIEDFLSAAVLQGGRVDLSLRPVEVEQVVCNVALQYSMSAAKKDITLRMDDLRGRVLADPHRLTQIVGNLLSNAIKYSPPGSMVGLWLDDMGGRLRLNLLDQGPGVPPEERDRLFTEFGKLSPRPTGQESSTGLGLWIVRSLAELMGGSVGCEFPADGGSIFWVELPAA